MATGSCAVCYGDLELREDLREAVRRSVGLAQPCAPGLLPLLTGCDGGTTREGVLVAMLQQAELRDGSGCQVLVLTATRQSALQLLKDAQALGRRAAIRCEGLVGGQSVRQDIASLGKQPQVVIGTLGRALDFIAKRHLVLDQLRMVVFDELHLIFSEPHCNQLQDACKTLPRQVQVCCFSPGGPSWGSDVINTCVAAIRSCIPTTAFSPTTASSHQLPRPGTFSPVAAPPVAVPAARAPASRPPKPRPQPAAHADQVFGKEPQGDKAGITDSFDDLDISENLLRGIYSYGFERPSAVQQRAIKPILLRRDTIFQSQSGTGKTATYTIGVLGRLDMLRKTPQALILAPARELAIQIQKVVLALGDYMKVKCHACIGGTSVRDDIDRLRDGVHVVVGMTGRVFDMVSKRYLRVDGVSILVLDEADEMLSRTFQDGVYDILKSLPANVQAVCCSATLPPEILDKTQKFSRDAFRVLVRNDELLLEGVRHFFVDVEKEEWKFDTLCDLFEAATSTQTMVFCNSRRKVDWLVDLLQKRNLTASCLHAELDQKERDLVMREFRSGQSRVLLSTSMLARGIDVQQVSLVLHFDLPCSMEEYAHRAGRAGRFGRHGTSVVFRTACDVRAMNDIERHYQMQFEELPMDFEDYL